MIPQKRHPPSGFEGLQLTFVLLVGTSKSKLHEILQADSSVRYLKYLPCPVHVLYRRILRSVPPRRVFGDTRIAESLRSCLTRETCVCSCLLKLKPKLRRAIRHRASSKLLLTGLRNPAYVDDKLSRKIQLKLELRTRTVRLQLKRGFSKTEQPLVELCNTTVVDPQHQLAAVLQHFVAGFAKALLPANRSVPPAGMQASRQGVPLIAAAFGAPSENWAEGSESCGVFQGSVVYLVKEPRRPEPSIVPCMDNYGQYRVHTKVPQHRWHDDPVMDVILNLRSHFRIR